MTDQDLKTFDPFAIPTPVVAKQFDESRADRIGAKNGFDIPPAPQMKPKKKKAPAKVKAKPPEVKRLRHKRKAEPKAQFNQRVPVEVANGFYDYARETNLPMGTVLKQAYEALMAVEAKRIKRATK